MNEEQLLMEKTAKLCHMKWSGWMIYLFGNGEFNNDGTWIMPAWAVERWARQARTAYEDLSGVQRKTHG